jgi:hypothetical protein
MCHIWEVQNFRGTSFQCDYQLTGFQNACFTQQRKVAPHGKEHLFPLQRRESSDIEHFSCRGHEKYTIEWLKFFNGSKPFLGGTT